MQEDNTQGVYKVKMTKMRDRPKRKGGWERCRQRQVRCGLDERGKRKEPLG